MALTEPLYPHQTDALDRMVRGDPVYLGFDPGLGKSRTALEGAARRKARRVLVLAPASGRYVWESEVAKWSAFSFRDVRNPSDLTKGDGVYLLSYGLVSQDDTFARAVANGQPFDMTVLDEAAALKNPGANRTSRVLVDMLPKLGYTLPMSGTPAPNHAGELFPILRALYPQAIVGSNGRPLLQWQFEDTFCKVVEKRFGQRRPVRVIEGSRNLAELRRRIEGFMLRVRKGDVLKDLPPVRYDIVPLDVGQPSAGMVPTALVSMSDEELLRYLNRATGDEHIMALRRMLGLCKVQSAIEYIDDFLTNLPKGRKVLVFAHHTSVITALLKGLQDWSPVAITGASTTTMREHAVNTFLTDSRCRLFVGNIQASGTGLTLVGPTCACSDVIFVEASYSVGENVQAAARVHRIGQHEGVVARFLTAHGTIDDRIQAILVRKAKDFQQLFD